MSIQNYLGLQEGSLAQVGSPSIPMVFSATILDQVDRTSLSSPLNQTELTTYYPQQKYNIVTQYLILCATVKMQTCNNATVQ